MQKTDKRYILITDGENSRAWYSDKVGYVLPYDGGDENGFFTIYNGHNMPYVANEDAEPCTPVVIDGMLYAVNGYAKSGSGFF